MGGKIWFYAGSSILALLVASALLAPFIAPHDPAQQNLDQDLLTYSSDHLFGTDKLGRDVLSRTLYGGRVSLLVGVITVAISLSLGFAIGSLSGYLGGRGGNCVVGAGDGASGLPAVSSPMLITRG